MRAGVGIALALAVVALAQAASATPPGRNGQLAFVGETKAKKGAVEAVYSLNLDGTGFRRISSQVRGAGADLQPPAWAPGGRRLAVSSRGLIWTLRPDGSGVRRLHITASIEDLGGHLPFYLYPESPVWAPNGKKLGFVYGGNERYSNDGQGIFAVAPAGGTAKKILDTQELRQPVDGIAGFDWSPDSRSIVLGAYILGDERDEILVARLGGPARIVTHPPEDAYDVFPSWSPDGKTIAYVRRPETGGELRLVGANGKGDRALSLPAGVVPGTPAWSPDSRFIAYASAKQIHIVDVAAGTEQVVTPPTVRSVRSVAWQPLPR